jgi:RNA polymerase sigma-70 factor, ECF subfamily
MEERELLTKRFEEERPRLRAVAYRLLGSMADADDAVQEAWLRLDRAESNGAEIENLSAWLTTVVARISLNALRSRKLREAEDIDDVRMPDPVIAPADTEPEAEALVADSVGLALFVVLETLTPAERLAFVLHDVFSVPFDQIAELLERTPEATRQLASRARRRVRGSAPEPDSIGAQREVVEAFFAAGRDGDFERLVELFHPDAVMRVDLGPRASRATARAEGREAVLRRATLVGGRAREVGADVQPATVNGVAGAVVVEEGAPVAVMAFTVIEGRIAGMDIIGDPDRVPGFDYSALEPPA